jgi:hypothetical protein
MPTGEAAKNILFQQYQHQQQQDRELLKELWRKRHSHRAAKLEQLTRANELEKVTRAAGMIRARSDMNINSDSSSGQWWLVIPSQRVRARVCDEVPDEFKRAGIGLCFEGKSITMVCLGIYFCLWHEKETKVI